VTTKVRSINPQEQEPDEQHGASAKVCNKASRRDTKLISHK
jgi:hypothetical protein